jgi:NodT family efflux transporter outer membrane factor (OMF) lipoprotein
VGPDYQPPALATPVAWTHAADNDRAKTEDLSRWWLRLDDPLLTDLVRQALSASPDLKGARAKLQEARARRALAGANRFPTATASASASRSKGSAETGRGATNSLYSAGFDADWELDVFGGVRRAEEAAQADLEASQASLYGTQVSLAAETALNYVEIRAFQGRLAIAKANLASQAETLQLTEWRAQAGLTTVLDVDQARTSLEQIRAQIPALETSLAEAQHRLAILLGRPPGALDARLARPGAIPAVPDRAAVSIPADTLRQRPDVRAAERRLAAETARIGVAEASRYPSFTWNGSLGLEALTVDGLTEGNALAGSFLARVAGTIFDAGRLRQQVEIQGAVRDQALADYEATVLTALEEVENALVSLANHRRRREALGQAAQAAASAERLARQQYAAGLVDFQTVLNTQRALLVTQEALKSGEADTASALIQLYKALGGGWSPAAAAPRP